MLYSVLRYYVGVIVKNVISFILQEGLRRTIDSYPDLRAECQPKREGPSKASICLGSGRGKRPQCMFSLLLLS